MNKLSELFIFILGATFGSVVTYKIVEKKFKDIADEEIESVKENFKQREKINKSEEIQIDKSDVDGITIHHTIKDYETYKNIIKNYKNDTNINKISDKIINIKNYNNESNQKDENNINEKNIIEIISAEEFGNLEGYDESFWVLYNGDILVDEFNKKVDNPKLYIGDALEELTEDQESIFVRNHETNIDYEILRVDEDFTDDLIP